MNSPMVSVIIPTYNRAQQLPDALKSIFNQTYHHYEVIIIDDGSTDDTGQVIHQQLKQDGRLHYIKTKHIGRSAARNIGIDCARGKYIAFLDSDDYWMPTKLEMQVRLMETGAVWSHTSYCRVFDNNMSKIYTGYFTGKVYPRILFRCPIATPTVMILRSALNSYRFNEKVNIGEDTILWNKLARAYPLLGINEPLTVIRTDKNGTNANLSTKITGVQNVIKYSISESGTPWKQFASIANNGYIVMWRIMTLVSKITRRAKR